MATMTTREFYQSVIEKVGAETPEGAFAAAQLAKMDERLSARKAVQTAAQRESAELAERILSELEPEVVYTAAQIGSDYGISSQKASAILRTLTLKGSLAQTEVKIKACKAEGIKGGKVKGYMVCARA